VRPEAVPDQHSWFPVSTLFGFGVEDTLEPLQGDLGIGISLLSARILPSGRGKGCPVASVCGSWPDDHGVQILTLGRDTFDSCDGGALDTRASVVSHVILTYKDFDTAWHGKHS